jgi:hypothetical protein
MIIHRLRARQVRPRIKEQWQYAAFVFCLTLFLSMSSNWFMRMNTFMLGLPTVHAGEFPTRFQPFVLVHSADRIEISSGRMIRREVRSDGEISAFARRVLESHPEARFQVHAKTSVAMSDVSRVVELLSDGGATRFSYVAQSP